MSTSTKPPYIEKLEERGNLQVWIVNGNYIRGHIDEEFTNFGQHCQYPYIPENELWIDHAANPDDFQFFIDNMLVMHRLTEKGVPYDKALAAAEQAERKERRRAGDVKRLDPTRAKIARKVRTSTRSYGKSLATASAFGLLMGVWYAACSTLNSLRAAMTMYTNSCRRMRSG